MSPWTDAPILGLGVSTDELNPMCFIRKTNKMCTVGGSSWNRV